MHNLPKQLFPKTKKMLCLPDVLGSSNLLLAASPLDLIRCHIMENMDDAERVAWLYIFWKAIQRCLKARRRVWVHQSLPVFFTPAP